MLVAQSGPTLCNPMNYSLPGSSVHGILPAGILEQVAIPYSRGSSQSRDQTRSPSLQADSLLSEPSEKPHLRVIVVKYHCCRKRYIKINIRVWLSLVERLNGVQEAAGSTPVTRTKKAL